MIRYYLEPQVQPDSVSERFHQGASQVSVKTTIGFQKYLMLDTDGIYLQLEIREPLPEFEIPVRIVLVSLRDEFISPLREPGKYEFGVARGEVELSSFPFRVDRKVQLPSGYYLHEVEIRGVNEGHVRALYEGIKDGSIRPSVSYAKDQIAATPAADPPVAG